MSMSMPMASVIVPARDAGLTLGRTLGALTAQDLEGGYEVIVVDDGSRDDTAGIAADGGSAVRLIQQPRLGPAAARNRGVVEARAPLLAFCDADVFPEPGWLAAGVRALQDADIVQGQVLPDPGATLDPFARTLWITSQVGLWETANLFVTRSAFERAGGFEEWLRPRRGKALAEDVWFGYRALRTGARPAYCPDALARHAVFARSWRRLRGRTGAPALLPGDGGADARAALLVSAPARVPQPPQRAAGPGRGCGRGGVGSGSPLPWLAVAPYARELNVHARRFPQAHRHPAAVAAADLAADLVGLAALVGGSLRYRSPVL